MEYIRSTNLLRNGALTAARVALKHVEFHVQYGLAVAQVAALAVKSGKGALRQITSQRALKIHEVWACKRMAKSRRKRSIRVEHYGLCLKAR